MFTFARTFDYELVTELLRAPRIYRVSAEDNAPPRETINAIQDEQIWYVECRDEEYLFGLWLFVPQTSVCWEVHTLMQKNGFRKCHRAASECARWIWDNTPCRRIVTTIPEYNTLAKSLAESGGMVQYGYNPASFLKGGKLHGQYLYGMSKPEPV